MTEYGSTGIILGQTMVFMLSLKKSEQTTFNFLFVSARIHIWKENHPLNACIILNVYLPIENVQIPDGSARVDVSGIFSADQL